jgi:hypothetical protein
MNERRNTMKKFILFYKGPPTPPGASHEKWPAWFNKLGKQLVDKGSPMQHRLVLHKDGSTSGSVTNFNGYSIIQAENLDEALRLIKDHPFLTIGTDEFTVEVFELPS